MKNYNIVIIWAILIISFVVVCACIGSQSSSTSTIAAGANQDKLNAQNTISNQGTFVPTPIESQTDRNTRIANEIVANYHKSHIYSLNDMYVCVDEVVKKIERQLTKHKQKQRDNKHSRDATSES